MATETLPGLQITGQWGRLNDTIIALLDYIPDDKLDWSPQEELWNFRGILLHTIVVRDAWLNGAGQDDEKAPNIWETDLSKATIQKELQRSWERLQRFLADPAHLAAVYERTWDDEETLRFNGHWMAFHVLEHDIHHRADIFHYLALLGIEHPEVGTP